MGLNAGLYIIPAKKFAVAQAKETWDRHRWDKCRPWFDLDKAWSQFDQVFKKRSVPLSYAIAGDIRIARGELGFNLVSPHVVAQIARALAELPTEAVVDEIERDWGPWETARRERERGYYETFFAELRKAYTLAASQGAAVGILIC